MGGGPLFTGRWQAALRKGPALEQGARFLLVARRGGEGTVPSEERDHITGLFDHAGCHTLSLEAPTARDGPFMVVRRPGEDRPAP
jgi:hypothetical protein